MGDLKSCPFCGGEMTLSDALGDRVRALEEAGRSLLGVAHVGGGKIVCPSAFVPAVREIAAALTPPADEPAVTPSRGYISGLGLDDAEAMIAAKMAMNEEQLMKEGLSGMKAAPPVSDNALSNGLPEQEPAAEPERCGECQSVLLDDGRCPVCSLPDHPAAQHDRGERVGTPWRHDCDEAGGESWIEHQDECSNGCGAARPTEDGEIPPV